MNQLLKWGIENSDATTVDPSASTDPTAERSSGRPLNSEALQALLGGPSNADLMKSSMAAIQSGEVPLDQKLVAFDNFEQLIENIDNANNMESLGLWTPLVELLGDEQAEIRRMAAWCIGTAVQNNERAQEKVRGLPFYHLVELKLICVSVSGLQRNTNTCQTSTRR